MFPFTSITGPAVPFLEDDLNTDQIAPIQMVRELKPDYADRRLDMGPTISKLNGIA
ncbi:MAG: hypothetical protein ABL907_08140 [Hyphomicrobium sp.]